MGRKGEEAELRCGGGGVREKGKGRQDERLGIRGVPLVLFLGKNKRRKVTTYICFCLIH